MKSKVVLITNKKDLIKTRYLFLIILEEMQKYYVSQVIDDEIKLYSQKYFLFKYTQKNSLVFGLFIDKNLIGFQLLSIESGVVTLEWSGILPEYRGRRHGSFLKLEVEKYLKKNKLGHKLICDCLTTNTESISNLRRSGFNIISEAKNHWGNQDYFFWEKFLS